MDLLTRAARRLRIITALGAVWLAAGCAGGPADTTAEESSAPGSERADEAQTELSALLARGGEIEPVHDHERVVARADGPGSDPVVFAGRSDRFVTVYVRCLAEEPDVEVAIDVALRRVDDVVVPCDGIISRSDVFTEPSTPVEVSISGPPEVVWTTLVTTRTRNLPRPADGSRDR